MILKLDEDTFVNLNNVSLIEFEDMDGSTEIVIYDLRNEIIHQRKVSMTNADKIKMYLSALMKKDILVEIKGEKYE